MPADQCPDFVKKSEFLAQDKWLNAFIHKASRATITSFVLVSQRSQGALATRAHFLLKQIPGAIRHLT